MKLLHYLGFFLIILYCPAWRTVAKTAADVPVTVTVEKKDATGEDIKDGEILLRISGGIPPYTIHCFSPYAAPSEKQGSELKFENAGPGDYLFVIQDKSGKTITRETIIGIRK